MKLHDFDITQHKRGTLDATIWQHLQIELMQMQIPFCALLNEETKGVNKCLKRQSHSGNGQEIKCHEIENLI